MTETAHHLPFREYLRLQGMWVKDPPKDDEYDALILMVWEFFSLRVRAENYFEQHKYVAKSVRGALPLPWREIKAEFESPGPPETTLTLIAKRHYGTIDTLIGNIRKVLKREREKVPIGRVQQVDSHCLRWLTRQPGYSPVEKAGARQEILGVVRRENFDTLENRVLKDFLQRCLALSSMYLRKYEQIWPNDENVIKVKRLKGLCIGALNLPEFEKIKAIADLPQPNYVLQQDRLYSRIWGEYLKILREEDVAERMWDKRDEVAELHKQLHEGVALHCSPCAKYDTPIWFNELDGRIPIVEAPIWDNDTLPSTVVEPYVPKEEVVAIDLTNPWDGRGELIIPNNHPNARPFIQNPHRPSREPGKVLHLEQVIEDKDAEYLSDYFRHLHGILGGKRWIVLVPDHWEAAWLERVICSRPSAIGSRSNFFLLWRSVAAALECAEDGKYRDGDEIVVADGYSSGKYNGAVIRFKDDKTGRAVPQRSSARLHGGKVPGEEVRFCLECDKVFGEQLKKLASGKHICRIGTLRANDGFALCGAKRFIEAEARGQVPYFDELDALSLVVTNQAEEVYFEALVEHKDMWPGGQKYEGKEILPPPRILRGERTLRLYLAEGTPRNDSELKTKSVEFEKAASEDGDVFCQSEITPGQGLAIVHVRASFLERPLLLDLQTMTPSDMTLVRIERELKRHFPPTMPYVEACPEIWEETRQAVNDYWRTGEISDGGLFAKAQSYWGKVDPNARPSSGIRRLGIERVFDGKTMSPIDRLKRENVFGNNPHNRLPAPAKAREFSLLFRRLAQSAELVAGNRPLRLLAWTYQYDNPDLESLRSLLFDKYQRSGTLDQTEITFCSNNLAVGDPRIGTMLNIALSHIAAGTNTWDELRLAYNLMQFHPRAIAVCESPLCEQSFAQLTSKFNNYNFYSRRQSLLGEWVWRGADATQKAGYLIKCLLFILHRRRFDSQCLKAPSGWQWGVYQKKDGSEAEGWIPSGLLKEPLPIVEHESEVLGGIVLQYGNIGDGAALPAHEATRNALIEYVNGRGTLEGIPTN